MNESDTCRAVRRWCLAIAAVWLPAMAMSVSADSVTFERVPLAIHADRATHSLTVEVARTAAQRSRGLMARDSLAEDAGMLFLYDRPQPPWGSFWMYRTRIALDIAFLDTEGHIAAIYTMQPCRSSDPGNCPSTRAGVSYRAALEVNAGYFAERGIEIGDCVAWAGQGDGCGDEPVRD